LGSDIVELTSRAGLQLRGLASDGAEQLASILSRGGLLRSLGHDRVRNILAAPLAGRAPAALADVDGVVEELDRALCADPVLAELPGRFLFAVDDGSRALDPLRADVELIAERDTFRLCLDGFPTSLTIAAEHASDVALQAARAFLSLRLQDADGAWRVRELGGGAARLAQHLGLGLQDRMLAPAAGRGRGLGLRLQRDGLFALAVLPPLARLAHAQLRRLAVLARALDVDVRISPWRTLTFVDVPASAAGELLEQLQSIGLLASEASGWAGLSACAGLGACARARADVRAAAAQRAAVRRQDSPPEHWSGCERRCGEPASAGIRFVAGARA
jgi:sulfite reductase beta subunit-like hemoprotein